MLKQSCWTALPFAMLMAASSAQAQQGSQGVAYSPGSGYDKLSWSAFVDVVKPAPNPPGTVTFNTWPTDAETFTTTPAALTGAVAARQRTRFQPSLLSIAHLPAGLAAQAQAAGVAATCSRPGNPAAGNFPTPFRQVPPTNCIAEEVVRNPSSFQYITKNDLNTQSGLMQAFAQDTFIEFPADAIEVKIDWVPVPTLVKWLSDNGVNVASGFVERNYFITEDTGTKYAMTSMHISTKDLPDWLWATFEHYMNPGRCDTMGCYDQYGVLPPLTSIPPHAVANSQYPACPKSPQLATMFKKENLSDVWDNYCLKATQIDFVSTQSASKGRPVLDGDSVIEPINANVPIAQASCVTCHAYATFNKDGHICRNTNTGLGTPSPIGVYNPQAGQKSYDFVWGILAIAGILANC